MNEKIETAINEMAKDLTFEKHELLRLYWYFANRQYQGGLFVEVPAKDDLPFEAFKLSSKLHHQYKLAVISDEILELILPLLCRETNEHFYKDGDMIMNGGKEGNDISITYHDCVFRFTVTGHTESFVFYKDLIDYTKEWLSK